MPSKKTKHTRMMSYKNTPKRLKYFCYSQQFLCCYSFFISDPCI